MRVIIALALLVSAGCTSSTVIRSSDPDARIYVNGEYLGTGRAHYSDEKVAFSRNEVEIKKDGCQSEHYSFRRNEEADIGAIIGGIFFTIPYLWITEYKDRHNYDYRCESENI